MDSEKIPTSKLPEDAQCFNIDRNQVKKMAAKHPRPNEAKRLSYGTAGFRARGDELDHVVFRMGILACLRAAKTKGTAGLMITASHNPASDNGIKIVEGDGSMLNTDWEVCAEQLANCSDEDLLRTIGDIQCRHEISAHGDKSFWLTTTIHIGRDTRPSSPSLKNAAIDGVECIGAKAIDHGKLTTPQLHYIVALSQTRIGLSLHPHVSVYYDYLSAGFISQNKALLEDKSLLQNYTPELWIDGANGIGARQVQILYDDNIKPELKNFKMKVFNKGEGELNSNCGADYVKIQQLPPINCEMVPNRRFCSFDGDADRIVYFYADEMGQFHLLDGDKIAVLMALYIKGILYDLHLDQEFQPNVIVVQTAYANGSSTKYIQDQLCLPVKFTPTGVKHLHHEASQADIGIYFEANGHGTVLFNESWHKKVLEEDSSNIPAGESAAVQERGRAKVELFNLIQMMNQATGDAISNMLIVETILMQKGMSIVEWDILYSDLPNKQLKVTVPNRSAIKTAEADRICVEPRGMQIEIDRAVNALDDPNARSFVRPSGTEDIVRVYAEATTQENVDKLANEVKEIVLKFVS